MTTKASYSAEEWAKIMRAPGMAGAYVMLASKSGPLQVMKEALAIGQTLAETEKAGGEGAVSYTHLLLTRSPAQSQLLGNAAHIQLEIQAKDRWVAITPVEGVNGNWAK